MNPRFKKTKDFLEKYDVVNFSKDHKLFIFFGILLILGMAMGSIFSKKLNIEALHAFDFLFLNDFKSRISETAVQTFSSSLSSLFVFVLLLVFLALSFFGAGVIPVLSAFRGFGLGVSAGYLYMIYGLKGIAFYLLILLPGIFISSVAFILLFSNGFNFSVKCAKKLLPKDQGGNLWPDFKFFCRKLASPMVLILLSSVIDAAFTAMFSKFFEF